MTWKLTVIETGFVDALQTVGGFGGRADRLNMYAFYAGDPGYVAADLRRYRDMTADDVVHALRRSVAETSPVVLQVVPRGRHDLAQAAGLG